jgi:uncharacterized protein YndB with AHSA1/START domain
MQKLHFSIHIDAPREKVWDLMLADATYREWTAAFNPGSYYKGSWEQGAEIRFLGPNPEKPEEEGGMLARIKENRLHEFLSIEHYGMVQNGVDDTTSEAVKSWAPAYENYTFVEKDGGTELLIDMDSEDKYAEMFSEMWPKSLEALKALVERY